MRIHTTKKEPEKTPTPEVAEPKKQEMEERPPVAREREPDPEAWAGDNISRVSVKVKMHGAVLTVDFRNVTPLGAVEFLQSQDPEAEFETQLFKQRGGPRETKTAPVMQLTVDAKGDKPLLKAVFAGADGGEEVQVWHDPDRDRDVLKQLEGLDFDEAQAKQIQELLTGDRKKPVVMFVEGQGMDVTYEVGRDGRLWGVEVTQKSRESDGGDHVD